jgi:acetylornithine aminotransferase/acetylornithine/N-succinyldiaminopimelate aminotransferase
VDVIAADRDPVELDAEHVLQVYRRSPVVFESGQGCALISAAGERYLDLISGVGVASLGHAHPRLSAALADQARTLVHTSNLFHHPLQGELAAKLADLSGLPRAFFCNSGAEAVEACLKFARRYWYAQGTPRSRVVALQHSFHGRTAGALSVTWDEHYRAPFAPLVPDVVFVPAGDVAALNRAITHETAAVIVEPIQGEGGVRPLTQTTADVLAEACARTGALLIADEVQSGSGRTGVPFYSSRLGRRQDLMALGKALGAGVPIGAALVFLDELTSNGLLAHVANIGSYFEAKLTELASRHPCVTSVRGAGVMWGLELDTPAAGVVQAAFDRHLLINRTSDTVVRLLPPFVITEREIDQALPILEAALKTAVEEAR